MRRAFASAIIAGLLVAGCGDDSVTGGGTNGGGGSDQGGSSVGGIPSNGGGPEGGNGGDGPQGGEGGGKPGTCGDGNTDAGEDCDDGNNVDGDDCDSNCTPTGCGNEIVTAGEACDDGNDVNGDDCDNNCTVPGCGNGVIRGDEVCDDGNLVDDDGCDSNCTVTACGNNITAGDEDCDDGNVDDDDGCDSNCTPTACGNGIVTTGEDCDDNNVVDGDGCDSNCTETACGNGIVTVDEECDDGNLIDGDGCSSLCLSSCGDSILDNGEACDLDELGTSTCSTAGFTGGNLSCTATCALDTSGCVQCGNNTIEANEDCDGGNAVDGDGCSALCQTELTEMEPNEDGTPSTGGGPLNGNDFGTTNPDTNGAISPAQGPGVNVTAAFGVIGDEDIWPVTNPGTSPITVRFDTYNLAATFGWGVSCGTSSIDTAVNIRDAAGALVLQIDDRSGTDWCAGGSFVLAAGQTLYVQVLDRGDLDLVPSYGLQVRFLAGPVCGDGAVTAGEQCDDDNIASGDGCSATCAIEGATAEIEPNGTTAEADANAVQITADTLITGSITDVTDEVDMYRLVLATDQVVRFETFTGLNACAAGTATTLRVRDSAGVQLTFGGTDSTSGIANCSAITRFLTTGTYYVSVEESGTNASVPFYALEVDFQTNGGTETEPNDLITTPNANLAGGDNVFVFGGHQVVTDEDWYTVTVPAGASIRAELIEGDAETCESLEVDSRITLYNPAGTQIDDDDDTGRGFCSMLDGTGAIPLDSAAHNLPAGTYSLQVRRSGTETDTTAQFDYRLVVTVRAP